MNWEQLLSLKRQGDTGKRLRTEQDESRLGFDVDYDRIIFSAAFRSLQDKTQVIPLSKTGFVHTRLTHSLEVSVVGRSLGRLVGKKILEKLKKKNKGNILLVSAIETLIKELEESSFSNQTELLEKRKDADCVHSDGFYFFDINIHRTLILIEFEENGEITIVWCGSHDEDEIAFKNNKSTIQKWLKERDWIN